MQNILTVAREISHVPTKKTWRERFALWLLGAADITYVSPIEGMRDLKVLRTGDRYVLGEITEVLEGEVARVRVEDRGDLIEVAFFTRDIDLDGNLSVAKRQAYVINLHSIKPERPPRLLAIPPEVLGRIREKL